MSAMKDRYRARSAAGGANRHGMNAARTGVEMMLEQA